MSVAEGELTQTPPGGPSGPPVNREGLGSGCLSPQRARGLKLVVDPLPVEVDQLNDLLVSGGVGGLAQGR